MAWAAGTFSRLDGSTACATDAAGSVGIIATTMDTRLNDLATGINNTLNKAGQNAATADLPMGGFKHTNVAAATARTEYARVSQVQDAAYRYGGTSTGAANVYAVTLTPAPSAYTAGMEVIFYAHQTNTAACTLNVNGLGAINIVGSSGPASMRAGEVKSGQLIVAVYDSGGGGRFRKVSSYPGSYNTFTPSSVTPGGTMTCTNQAVLAAEYAINQEKVDFLLAYQFDIGGTPHADLFVNLPLGAASGTYYASINGYVNSSGLKLALVTMNTTSQMKINRSDLAVWAAGASQSFVIGGSYKVA